MKALISDGPLAVALHGQRDRLLPCVHCGFCLPACPTYNRLGNEADSPRGRLHLMQAVVDGRIDAGSDAFQTHIDRCLGCRACEPVCPSGVEYGALLELAREAATAARPASLLSRALLKVMASSVLRLPFFLSGRVLRGTGLASGGARLLPDWGRLRSARLALSMLAATRRWRPLEGGPKPGRSSDDAPTAPEGRGRVGLLSGCVQEGLYARINRATERTLRANGYEVVVVDGQDCCGALHAHGGELDRARALALRNVKAFEAVDVDYVAVNAAGCGAAMKDYGTLFELDQANRERVSELAGRVRDVTELLAQAGPRRGAAVPCTLAYDHPCHLLHGQGVERAPLDVLSAIPGVEVRVVEDASECCGGAGIYGMTHPDLGGEIGRDKVRSVRAEQSEAVCTPNAGCMMQIGAGLRLEGASEGVIHPVELLDESYERAGYYE